MAVIVKGKNLRKPHTVRYQDHGKQRELSFATPREAKDFKIKYEHDHRAKIFVDPRAGKIMFTEAVTDWITRHPLADGTRRNYLAITNAHIAPAFAGMTLAQVAQDRESVVTFLTVTMPAKVTQPRVLHARSIMLQTIEEAARAGRIPAGHRLSDLDLASAGHKTETFVHATFAQVTAITDGLRRKDLALSVWLMRGCGLRVSEALAVNVKAFREGGKILRVSEQVTPDGKALAPLKSRKVGEYRDVPVPAWLWAKVCAQLATFGTPVDGYLFRTGKRYVAYSGFRLAFAKQATKAGLPAGYGFHQLRHSFASEILDGGGQIHELAEWLGHRDINVTIGTYGHLLPSAMIRGREALEAGYANWSTAGLAQAA
jgi:integrase